MSLKPSSRALEPVAWRRVSAAAPTGACFPRSVSQLGLVESHSRLNALEFMSDKYDRASLGDWAQDGLACTLWRTSLSYVACVWSHMRSAEICPHAPIGEGKEIRRLSVFAFLERFRGACRKRCTVRLARARTATECTSCGCSSEAHFPTWLLLPESPSVKN